MEVTTHLPYCNTLQHPATRCNLLQHITKVNLILNCLDYESGYGRDNTLQHTATHCNTLQHTATHGNSHLISGSAR